MERTTNGIRSDVEPVLENAASVEAHTDKAIVDLHPQVLGLVAASEGHDGAGRANGARGGAGDAGTAEGCAGDRRKRWMELRPMCTRPPLIS